MSVFLPKTSFNLYADAKESEKEILEFWEKIDLENLRKTARSEAEQLGKKFILHDGPPYANGSIHIGHAENKFWKDALNKIFWQSGYSTPYIPGWDSHGLPIENAVEKELKNQNINKHDLTRQEFWDKCYSFSQHWMNHQIKQFKALGIFADYENAYATFFEDESIAIMECTHEFVKASMLERRLRPVLWSYEEKTALAYAEVEYKNKTSNSVYVLFPVLETDIEELDGAKLIIWTTTPWTLPANEAIAYNSQLIYIIFKHNGQKYCVAKDLFKNIEEQFLNAEFIYEVEGAKFKNTLIDHCLEEFSYKHSSKKRKMLDASFVDDQKGSGFVHIAPAHGEDDFNLGRASKLNIEDLLDHNGHFKENIPLVAGLHIKGADKAIIQALDEQRVCVKKEEITHSYPHSWRSKAPLIYRLTKQWFLKMDKIKPMAMQALETTESWVPKESENRLRSMVEAREDWCVSRQRMWGVPIGIFFNEETGEVLDNPQFLDKIRAKLNEIGVKNWWNLNIEDIDANYSGQNWKRLDDIIEIWFESGATHYFVLKKMGLFPADVYLEGSDQHRGWFQSSLLISAFLNKRTPWKHLLTHGFCLDHMKQKMSKSLGNVINPDSWSADHLRVFFAVSNLCHDISLNENVIKNTKEMLFRFRNTTKFLLGILAVEEEMQHEKHVLDEINYQELPTLEKWLLNRVYEIDLIYENILKNFQLTTFTNALYEFCAQDLSAFYFDIRKDVLYCELSDHKTRQAAIMCIRFLITTLLKWLAPITPFFAEEAWQCYKTECKEDGEEKAFNSLEQSVHLASKTNIPNYFANTQDAENLEIMRNARKQITENIEILRNEKILNTTQEASITIPLELIAHKRELLNELKEVAIVADIQTDEKLEIKKMLGEKCPRCRFVRETLIDGLCPRCKNVVEKKEYIKNE